MLHYWYTDAGITLVDFSLAKQQILQEQMQRYRENQAIKRTPQVREIIELLNSQAKGQDLSAEISNLLAAASLPTSGNESGIGDLSYQQVANLKPADLTKKVSNMLINSLEECGATSQKALDNFIQVMEALYPAATSYAMAETASLHSKVSQSDLLNKVLKNRSTLIAVSPHMNFSAAETQMIQSYARLKTMINLIPSLGKAKVDNKSQLISTMVGKIGGNLSYMSGLLRDAAISKAAEVGNKTFKDKMKNFWNKFKNKIKGKRMQVNVTFPKEEDSEPISSSITYKKNDFTLKINNEIAELNYTKEIPKVKEKTNQATVKKLNFQTRMSLRTVLDKAMDKDKRIQKYYVGALAVSVQGARPSGLGAERATNEKLQEAWVNLIDYAGTLAFLDFINEELTLGAYFNINDRLWTAADIYLALISNPQALSLVGGRQRSKFWKLNESAWQGGEYYNRNLGTKRAVIVASQLSSAMNTVQMQAKLNIAALGLT